MTDQRSRCMVCVPRTLWLYALLLACMTSLPYLASAIRTPAGWQYSGAAAVPNGAQVDYNSHMAKMWQGSRGQWDYRLLFTHESHAGIPLVQGFYVALGALGRFAPLPVVYHLARFLLNIGVVLALWVFSARFFDSPAERWLCVLFGTLVAGWSWLLLLVAPATTQQVAPIEFWLTDAFTLLGMFLMPHFSAAVILQITAFLAFERWVDAQSPRLQAESLSVLMLALAAESIIQPYIVLLSIPLLIIRTAQHLVSTRKLRIKRVPCLGIPLGVHAALVAYQYVAMGSDPVWANFTTQNITASPDPLYYLLGYLPFILPILLGARRFLLDKANDVWWLPVLWVLLVAALLYAPLPTQRRYLLGVQTPLAALAAYGWTRAVLPHFRQRHRGLLTGIYIVLAAIAPFGLILANLSALARPHENAALFYQPDELAGYAWLREHAAPDDVVLTTFDWTGNGSGGKLVAATGQRVFTGHWIETAHFDDKIAQVRRFYDPATSDDWRRDFLNDADVAYVWYDDNARAVGEWNPSSANYLEEVLRTDTVTVYRVIAE